MSTYAHTFYFEVMSDQFNLYPANVDFWTRS